MKKIFVSAREVMQVRYEKNVRKMIPFLVTYVKKKSERKVMITKASVSHTCM